jgi:molybdate transport system regulatory protein
MPRSPSSPHREPSPRHPARLAPGLAPARRREAAPEPVATPRIRVLCGNEIALGPGKVALLEAIAAGGCLAAAARQLGMSYMRAWKLVQTMNACFREPLVATHRGGRAFGGATLTATGRRVLALYRGMEDASRKAIAAFWQDLRINLK